MGDDSDAQIRLRGEGGRLAQYYAEQAAATEQWPNKIHVKGMGFLGPGQVVHAVPGGGVLALEMKAAIAVSSSCRRKDDRPRNIAVLPPLTREADI